MFEQRQSQQVAADGQTQTQTQTGSVKAAHRGALKCRYVVVAEVFDDLSDRIKYSEHREDPCHKPCHHVRLHPPHLEAVPRWRSSGQRPRKSALPRVRAVLRRGLIKDGPMYGVEIIPVNTSELHRYPATRLALHIPRRSKHLPWRSSGRRAMTRTSPAQAAAPTTAAPTLKLCMVCGLLAADTAPTSQWRASEGARGEKFGATA